MRIHFQSKKLQFKFQGKQTQPVTTGSSSKEWVFTILIASQQRFVLQGSHSIIDWPRTLGHSDGLPSSSHGVERTGLSLLSLQAVAHTLAAAWSCLDPWGRRCRRLWCNCESLVKLPFYAQVSKHPIMNYEQVFSEFVGSRNPSMLLRCSILRLAALRLQEFGRRTSPVGALVSAGIRHVLLFSCFLNSEKASFKIP